MSRPPKTAKFLLRTFLSAQSYYAYHGDIEEIFHELAAEQGRFRAALWYWKQVLTALPSALKENIIWRISMFKNYAKICFRNLLKHKSYSFINLTGLSIGLVSCLLIFLWVSNELSFNRFHTHKDRIFRLGFKAEYTDGKSVISSGSFYPFAPILESESAEIETTSRFLVESGILIQHENKSFTTDHIAFVDPSFLDIFSFPLLKGSSQDVLRNQDSILLTESMARKYFGDQDPLGQVLTVNQAIDVKISGILEDVPINSSFQFDCLVSFKFIFDDKNIDPDNWGINPAHTYLMLNPNIDKKNFEKKIITILGKHTPLPDNMKITAILQPLPQMHLHSLEGGERVFLVVLFSLIAFLVLGTACFNFMNLVTAKSANRAKEVGIRKVIGAKKIELIRQFLGEAFFLILLALIIAFILIQITLPYFSQILGITLSTQMLTSPAFILIMLIVLITTVLLAGSYPAFFLSSFQPGQIIKGTLSKGSKSSRLRTILVVSQFSLSVFLIIGSLGIYRQLNFIDKKDLGFDKEDIIFFPLQGNLKGKYDTLKTEIMGKPYIRNITRSFQNQNQISSTVSKLDWERKPPEKRVSMNFEFVDFNYFRTFGMEFIAGRPFSQDFPSDIKEGYVVNEEAIKLMGMESPIGKRLSVFGNEGKIIGVVKNFHFRPLQFQIQPIVFGMDPGWGDIRNNVFIKVDPVYMRDALSDLNNFHKKFNPDYPFTWMLFEKLIEENYQVEMRMGKLIGILTLLAVFISGLGLLGLSAFLVAQKSREIGIRKVMGASSMIISRFLSKDFLKWVILANIIAWPAGYFFIHLLLRNFSYRAGINISMFILAALLSLTAVVLTIGWQVFKASRLNPADSLRYE
ncbi:MAG: ABC transporter permease [Candidatus Aminicenantes bacterium]|nr:ABC transporter permease [Candidatus Aminicenantes bacterium]